MGEIMLPTVVWRASTNSLDQFHNSNLMYQFSCQHALVHEKYNHSSTTHCGWRPRSPFFIQTIAIQLHSTQASVRGPKFGTYSDGGF